MTTAIETEQDSENVPHRGVLRNIPRRPPRHFQSRALLAQRGSRQGTGAAAAFAFLLTVTPTPAATASETGLEDGRVVSRPLFGEWGRTKEAIRRGLEYLRENRQPGGSIGAKYPLASTSLAGMAVLGAGFQPSHGPFSDLLSGCVQYVRGRRSSTGYLSDGQSRMHGHCLGVLFLTQAVGSLRTRADERAVTAVIARGVSAIERAQSSKGGWYYNEKNVADQDEASVTVCALQALRAARNVGFSVDSFRVEQAIRYVKRCQLKDGSFCYGLQKRDRSTFALTVAAVSTLNAAGVYKSSELTKGMNFVRLQLDRAGKNPWKAGGTEYPYYANLYAAQALYQEGKERWKAWFPLVRDYLIANQRPDGSWRSDSFGDEYATANALLILEIPLGYLPIFQR